MQSIHAINVLSCLKPAEERSKPLKELKDWTKTKVRNKRLIEKNRSKRAGTAKVCTHHCLILILIWCLKHHHLILCKFHVEQKVEPSTFEIQSSSNHFVLNVFRSCYLNRWFCKFRYISVSTIDLLGPGQHLKILRPTLSMAIMWQLCSIHTKF